jgi:cbb3-type cytochrome oxidase maturation protein
LRPLAQPKRLQALLPEATLDILYLLIPLSVSLIFFILGGLWWAIDRGQFDDIESEGARILDDEAG